MKIINLSNVIGQFNETDPVSNGLATSVINAISETSITIDEPLVGEFKIGDTIRDLTTGATAIVNNIIDIPNIVNDFLDLFSVFGGNQPDDFVYSDYIANLPIELELTSTQDFPSLTETESQSNYSTVAYPVEKQTVPNPAQPGKESPVRQDTRVVQNIANEPTYENNSKYPYNKSFQSEGGHLKEIDDTPGYERLLDQHACGTYQEMHADGNMVTKVINDKYTIIAGDGYITVEGQAIVHLMGNCNLRVGGALTITADGGVNIATKGDFRVKAKSINLESTSGDITAKSAKNITTTAKEKNNVKGKTNHIDSTELTSISTGQQFIVEAQKISQHSKTDTTIAADGDTYISAKGESNFTAKGATYIQADGGANIKTDSTFAITASTVEVDADLNVKNTTNMKAGGTDVQGYGASSADSAADAIPEAAIPAVESKGSGITYSANPDSIMMETDDDPEAAAAAIKQGIANGTIDPNELNAPVTEGERDSSGPSSNVKPSLTSPTVGDIGTSPDDNLRLSPNFTVSKLSKHTPAGSHIIRAQHGLSAKEITGNLQLLAINCLEKIKERFPDMQVTSAFRTSTGGKSQHERGMAADMQFASANKNKDLYFQYAQWIKENIPFDQLLLEYKTYGSKLPWIHISFNSKSNRKQILTLKNNATYGQGLIQLA